MNVNGDEKNFSIHIYIAHKYFPHFLIHAACFSFRYFVFFCPHCVFPFCQIRFILPFSAFAFLPFFFFFFFASIFIILYYVHIHIVGAFPLYRLL